MGLLSREAAIPAPKQVSRRLSACSPATKLAFQSRQGSLSGPLSSNIGSFAGRSPDHFFGTAIPQPHRTRDEHSPQ